MSLRWQSLLLSLACASSLYCVSSPEQNPPAEDVCGNSKRPMRVTARHIESNGIGYNQGYTTLEGFFSPLSPWGDCEQWVPFVDLRGHAFNDGRLAANAGLGLRYITNYVWGINAYYDYRDTHHQHYNQFAAGLEALGKIWDFRINGYLPLGRRNSKYYHTKFDKFEDHYLYLSRKKEVSMKGANAEVGFHIDHFKDFPFYFAGGPYYLNGTGRTTWGGQLRARVDIFDYLTLEGNVSYDHLFRWVGQGQVGINMPLGTRRQIKKSSDRSCTNSMALSTRALQRVDRFEIIPVDTKRFHQKAINPVTGDPYVFFFVDNTSHSLGTFESPFSTLMDAQLASGPNNVIMVFVGDGTTKGMNSGITLQDGQRLWGAGVNHTLPTTLGHIKVPILESGTWVNSIGNATFALLPIIGNSTNNVVTIGNNNEISGIFIQNLVGTGITTPLSKAVANLSIDRCTIEGSSTAIGLADLGGTLLVQSNNINESDTGIGLTNTAASLITVMLNNNFAGTGNAFSWHLTNNVQGVLTFDGNQINVASFGVSLDQANSASLSAVITNNQIASIDPITVDGDGTTATLLVTGNTLKAQGSSDAISIIQLGGSVTANIIGNQIFETSTSDEGIALIIDGSTTNFTIAENTVESNGNSILIEQLGGSLTGLIANNQLSSSSGTGILIENGSTSSNVLISENAINANSYAIDLGQAGGTLMATINNNTLASLTAAGVNSSSAATQNLTIANNVVNNAGDDDAGFSLTTLGTAVWQITGNTFNALPTAAVGLSVDPSSSLCLTFNDNIAYPIQFGGLGTYEFVNSGGTFTYNPLRGNTGQFRLEGAVEQGSCQ